MEIQRRHHSVSVHSNQENVHVAKGKDVVLPVKRQGLGVRGALGDVNTNALIQGEGRVGKVAVAAAEFEKKAENCSQGRVPLRSNYGHVQSKIDTGLPIKNVQPSARPSLRREESTAALAAKAVARTRAVPKETQNKVKSKDAAANILQPAKKVTKESKKVAKVPSFKEAKGKENVVKPILKVLPAKHILKEPTESLGKLKLADAKFTPKNSTEIHLPEDIEDIDAADKNNPLLLSIYIKDIYKYLTELELQYSIEPDHLRNQAFITGKMRETLVDWLVDVQQQFSLVLETFQLTVGIIDRYLQIVPTVKRNRLQLVGVTAMYMASKYEEVYSPDVGDFVYVTANAFTKADVIQCEREILNKLGFCLARPIPLSFLRRFVKAAQGTSKQHHLGKYFVDLCLVEYSMAHYRPSELAAAALCLSLHLLSNNPLDEVWTPTLRYYSEYTLEHIEPLIKKIAKVVTNVGKTKNGAVYRKYLDKSLASVASLPQLKGDTIQQLAQSSSSC